MHMMCPTMKAEVVGLRGKASFEEMVEHFTSMGGEVVLLNPDAVCGRDHVVSAVMHAERAFREGTNRSKTLLTEIILYAAWERQVGKALSKMRPGDDGRYVAVLIDIDEPRLDEIGMVRDDSLMEPDQFKMDRLGLRSCFLSPEEQAVERVAMVDLMKM